MAGGNDVRGRTDRTAVWHAGSNAAAIERLPDSGGVFGLIERSDPLVVTELIEVGARDDEPQRLGASGASWTQTSFRLGDADVTDPDRTGFAMFYPNLDAWARQRDDCRFTRRHGQALGHAGAQDSVDLAAHNRILWSPPALQSVNLLPRLPSIARLRAASGASLSSAGR
jgi:hypothetical protein